MTSLALRLAALTSSVVALSSLSTAQITSIGEFTGPHYTDLANVPLEPIKSRMTPAGFITTRNLHGFNGAITAGVAPHQTSSALGGRMLRTGANACTMPEDIRWRPINTAQDMGMFLGTNSSMSETVNFQFEDDQGNVIGNVDAVLAPGGTWTWVGFRSTVPVDRVEIHNPRAQAGVSILIDAFTTTEPGGSTTIGTSFGDATPNSTGLEALLCAEGSTSVATGDLTLRATQVPNHAFGLFLFAPTQGREPLGDGTLWLAAGQLHRLPVMQATAGQFEHRVDLVSTPITAGTTWHFQTFFRDPAAGGAGCNLSQGLTITFD